MTKPESDVYRRAVNKLQFPPELCGVDASDLHIKFMQHMHAQARDRIDELLDSASDAEIAEEINAVRRYQRTIAAGLAGYGVEPYRGPG
jgi:hypothetical protein